MSGACLFGQCQICGKETNLDITYFNYNIKCDCCSPSHFVRVEHCKDCIPEIPKIITPVINYMNGSKLTTAICDQKPTEIIGLYKE